jgi:hypothetical protein
VITRPAAGGFTPGEHLAFGTYVLLAALTEARLIEDAMEEDTQALADARVIELPRS